MQSQPLNFHTIEPCDICGNVGFPETLVTCYKCNINREHAYCMRKVLVEFPDEWLCESCKSKVITSLTTTPCKVNQEISLRPSKRQQGVPTGKVKFLHEEEVIKLSLGNFPSKPNPANSTSLTNRKAYFGSKNFISKIPSMTPKSNPLIPPKAPGKIPRNGIQKKSVTNQRTSCSLSKDLTGPTKECIGENQQPFGGLIPYEKVQNRDSPKEKPTNGAPQSSPIIGSEGGILCADAECNCSSIDKCNHKTIQENFDFYSKFLPSTVTAWKGQFQIFHAAASGEFYDGFEAQPPCIVSSKAYKFSCQMPSVLQLESLPALNVLTDIFQDDSPCLQDIALYFVPSELTERSLKNLNNILMFMTAEKLMLRSVIDGIELLVFTSKELDTDSKGFIASINAGSFLWGIFRQRKFGTDIVRVPKMEPVDMDIDMIGGKDVADRVDHVAKEKPNSLSVMECRTSLHKLDFPPGFEAKRFSS